VEVPLLQAITDLGLLPPTGMVQVGASSDQEMGSFLQHGIRSGIFIEPLPQPFKLLAEVCRRIPDFVTVNTLCSDKTGEAVHFFVASNGGQSSSTLKPLNHMSKFAYVKFDQTIQLVSNRPDDVTEFVKTHGHAKACELIDLIYMDTQGSELKVLKGAGDLHPGSGTVRDHRGHPRPALRRRAYPGRSHGLPCGARLRLEQRELQSIPLRRRPIRQASHDQAHPRALTQPPNQPLARASDPVLPPLLEISMNATASPVTSAAPAPAITPRPVLQADLFELLNLIRPWQMVSEHKVRMGADGDGGYVMPSCSLRSNTVLSIGIGNEVSFDNRLAELGARVLQFDHTIEPPPSTRAGLEFHRLGWGPRDNHPFVSLRSMVRMIDWSAARHPILKFDTEGAEWECLDTADSDDLDRFEVLTGEFHAFDRLVDRNYFDKALRVFQKIEKTHRVIHLHANNAGGMVMLGGLPFPRLLELTFMRRRSASFHGHSAEPIPGPLDRPNLPQLPDLVLRAF